MPPDDTDPTLTPSQAIGVAPTSASLTPAPRDSARGMLPARYTLGEQLGAGGMGEVLLAADKQIERDVAIKRMRVEPTPAAVARFMREAKIQGRLDHPAIVPVHELATDAEGRPFFVMKRLTGTTLAALLASTTKPPRQKLLRAFADVCLAIEFAHSRGVIHRDLKPANIMLGDYGEVYVLDWGVARRIDEVDTLDGQAPTSSGDDATEAGAILGTPGYIAPELLRGEHLDGKADVYALGCILFEILTGEQLLPKGKAALTAALEPVDAHPSHRVPTADVPPELDAVCVAATSLDRTQRPSARQLAERVERYLDGDRDLALRKSIAAAHVTAARTAFAQGDSATHRATAMREAGRAIALDPHSVDAAELVARLMLEPPREVPSEVDAKVNELERETGREKVKMMTKVMLSFFAFIPVVLVMGLRSPVALGIFIAVLAANVGLTHLFARQRRALEGRELALAGAMFAPLVLVISRMFSPFLLAPAIAAVAAMMFAMDPRTRWVPLTIGYIIAVLAPWLLELAGLVSRTTTSLDGDLLLHSDVVSLVMPTAEFGLALFTVLLIALAAYMASRLAQAQRAAVRRLELQAWHLRQLVTG